jgi:ribosomal protein S18 acetylase RimI-like enzyme
MIKKMETNRIQISRAIIENANILADFNVKMAKETENKELNFDKVLNATKEVFLSNDKGFYLKAIYNGKIVGSMLITYEWSDWRNGFFWWIQSVYVLNEYRNKGIFKSLYNYARNLAKEKKDVCGLRLYVDKDNEAAQNVYKKLGMYETNYLLFEEEF